MYILIPFLFNIYGFTIPKDLKKFGMPKEDSK